MTTTHASPRSATRSCARSPSTRPTTAPRSTGCSIVSPTTRQPVDRSRLADCAQGADPFRSAPSSTGPRTARSSLVPTEDTMAAARKWVYSFGAGRAEGRGDQKELLGGKGAGLHEMNRIGLPVPAGFTITTEACIHFYENGEKYP